MFKEDKMRQTEFNLSNPVPEREEDWILYDLVWEFHEMLYLIQGHFTDGNQDLKDILNRIIKFFFYFLKRRESRIKRLFSIF
jgi:hypothetical protein